MQAYLAALAERREVRVRAELSGDERALSCFRSSGGPSAGCFLVDHPDGDPTTFDDFEWLLEPFVAIAGNAASGNVVLPLTRTATM